MATCSSKNLRKKLILRRCRGALRGLNGSSEPALVSATPSPSHEGGGDAPGSRTISSANQNVWRSLMFLLPLTSCCLNAHSGSGGSVCVKRATLVWVWMSWKCALLVIHCCPSCASSILSSKCVSRSRASSLPSHVVNSVLVGMDGLATSCVSKMVPVLTCLSWTTSF